MNKRWTEYTKVKLRQPSTIVQEFRNLEILTNSFQSVGSKILLMAVNDLVIAMNVMCNFLMIRCHHLFNISSLALFFMISGISTLYLAITYVKFGEINELSKAVFSALRRNQSKLSSERCLVGKYIRSGMPLKIHLGTFGYYRKPNTIRIVGKLVSYTMRSLVLTKRFF